MELIIKVREQLKIKWEPKRTELIPFEVSEEEYQNRIARIAKILYIEFSQLEKVPDLVDHSIEPQTIFANSDQVA